MQVRTSGPVANYDENEPDYRLSVRTALLKNVDNSSPQFFEGLAGLNRSAPTYAFCSPDDEEGRVFLQSTAFVHRGIVGWLPRFFAGMAILQPIEAQFRADVAANALGGEPDRSRSHPADEMLEAEAMMYLPAGQRPSRWAGSDEFEKIIASITDPDRAFGTGDPTGLTIESSFGSDTALLRLLTDKLIPGSATACSRYSDSRSRWSRKRPRKRRMR